MRESLVAQVIETFLNQLNAASILTHTVSLRTILIILLPHLRPFSKWSAFTFYDCGSVGIFTSTMHASCLTHFTRLKINAVNKLYSKRNVRVI